MLHQLRCAQGSNGLLIGQGGGGERGGSLRAKLLFLYCLLKEGELSAMLSVSGTARLINVLVIFKELFFFQRSKIGPPEAEYSFPQSILEFIRFLVPGNIKGEIREVSRLQKTI